MLPHASNWNDRHCPTQIQYTYTHKSAMCGSYVRTYVRSSATTLLPDMVRTASSECVSATSLGSTFLGEVDTVLACSSPTGVSWRCMERDDLQPLPLRGRSCVKKTLLVGSSRLGSDALLAPKLNRCGGANVSSSSPLMVNMMASRSQRIDSRRSGGVLGRVSISSSSKP